MEEKIAIIDLDYILHAASNVGDTRFVEVNNEEVFSGGACFRNKTEFHGRDKKKGWLGEVYNKERVEEGLDEVPLEAFQIEAKKVATSPLANVLHSAKSMLQAVLRDTGATSYEAYLGKGEVFRVGLSYMQKYKGKRVEGDNPTMMPDVRKYLIDNFNVDVVEDIEVDDKVIIRCVQLLKEGKDAFVVAIDKDACGNPVKLYNPNRPELGIVDCRGFGELTMDSKGKVRGKGRLFKYFQISFGDPTDDYKANYLSKKTWGEKSSYKSLVDCKTDKEAWQVLADTYKVLYPEPLTFNRWGKEDMEEITMDYLQFIQEITDMVHMLRKEGDRIIVTDVLDKLGIEWQDDSLS